VPSLCEFYPDICLTTEEKARKNLSQVKKNLSQVKKNLRVQYTDIFCKLPPRNSKTVGEIMDCKYDIFNVLNKKKINTKPGHILYIE
jgi:hypothetical protein